MNLEIFQNGDKINGKQVIVMDKLRESNPEIFNEDGGMDWKIFERDIRPNNSIYIRHDKNSLSFTVEEKEKDIKGCDVITIIEAVKIMIDSMEPSREKSLALTKLQESVMWLKEVK